MDDDRTHFKRVHLIGGDPAKRVYLPAGSVPATHAAEAYAWWAKRFPEIRDAVILELPVTSYNLSIALFAPDNTDAPSKIVTARFIEIRIRNETIPPRIVNHEPLGLDFLRSRNVIPPDLFSLYDEAIDDPSVYTEQDGITGAFVVCAVRFDQAGADGAYAAWARACQSIANGRGTRFIWPSFSQWFVGVRQTPEYVAGVPVWIPTEDMKWADPTYLLRPGDQAHFFQK